MKKIRIGIAIILAILFLLSGKCQAQQETKLVVVSSNETIEVGEEIEIGIAVENLNMAACEITLNWDTSKLEWISQKKDNIHVVDNRIQYIWYDSKGGSMPKTGEFVRFRFRSKEAGNVSFSAEGTLYDGTGNEFTVLSEETRVEIQEQVTTLPAEPEVEDTQREINTNLETLAIEDTLLYPPFMASQTSYTAKIGNAQTTVKLLAIPEQESAIVAIEGNENLQEGNNSITVRVTAPSGAKKEYKIQVYKRNVEEEAAYEEEQAQMIEKVKEAYEIEKLSTSHASEKMPTEQKTEEEQKEKYWQGFVIILIGTMLGVGWYVLEMRKKKKKKI